MDLAKLEERVKVRRYKMLQSFPFYAILMQMLELKVIESIPNAYAYTDGKSIVFNGEHLPKLSSGNIDFTLAHEVRHITDLHLIRAKLIPNVDWKLFNVAADMRINWDLKKAGIGELPKGVHYKDKYIASWTTEDIYKDLQKLSQEDQDKLTGGGMDDHTHWDDSTGPDGAGGMTEQEVMQKVISAVQAADAISKQGGSNAGKDSVPESIRKMITDYLAPQVDWKEQVTMRVSEYSRKDKSWERMHRRFVHQGSYFPYYSRGETVTMAIALDQSGSISDEENKVALSEVMGAIEQLEDYEIYVMDFSTSIHQCRKFTPGDEFDYVPKGTGGTDLSCITDYLKEEEIEVDCMFVITDGYTCKWPDEGYCEDTTFLCTSNVVAPYGDTLKLVV